MCYAERGKRDRGSYNKSLVDIFDSYLEINDVANFFIFTVLDTLIVNQFPTLD